MNNKKEMSQEQIDKAVRWLNEKIPDFKCECCDSREFAVAREIIVNYLFEVNILAQQSVYPSVLVTCKNCGNIKQFSAVLMGLVD